MRMEKCEDCPLRGDGRPCVVQLTGHSPFCDWARDGGVRRARVAELSATTPATAATPPATDGRPGVARDLALIRLAKSCPFASRDAGCGCAGIRCGIRPAGRQVTHLQYCMSCVERYGA